MLRVFVLVCLLCACIYVCKASESKQFHQSLASNCRLMGIRQCSMDVNIVVACSVAGSLRRLANSSVSPTGENAIVQRYSCVMPGCNIILSATQ